MNRDSKALWIITKDSIFNPKYDDKSNEGRRSLAVTAENLSECTLRFKLFDDDGELYYEGRMSPAMLDNEELAFEPLDWSAGYAGCTTMEILRDGKWEVL